MNNAPLEETVEKELVITEPKKQKEPPEPSNNQLTLGDSIQIYLHYFFKNAGNSYITNQLQQLHVQTVKDLKQGKKITVNKQYHKVISTIEKYLF